MFIAHGEWLRKYSRWILAAVLLILVPGFVVLFSTTGGPSRRTSELPTIHGKPVNPAAYQQARAATRTQLIINGSRIPRHAPDLEHRITQEAVLRLLLLAKARELGVHVSEEELANQLRRLPVFAGPQGQFDPQRYQQYLIMLNHQGIGEGEFAQVMREQIIISQLRDLVASAAHITPDEARLFITPMQEKVTLDYVTFRVADLTNTVTVTETEAQQYFDQNREAFREPEKVKVRYALLRFADTRATLHVSDEELAEYYELNKSRFLDEKNEPKTLATIKDELRQELLDLRAERRTGDQATELSVKLVHEPGSPRPDLARWAATLNAVVRETDYFAMAEDLPDITAGRSFGMTAFSLSADMPFSDPVRGEDGYYVLELLDRRPSAIPVWELVRDRATERLRLIRAYEALVKQGTELATHIRQAVAAGANFAAACAARQLTVRTTPPFSLSSEPPDLPSASRVAQMAIGLPTNSVSVFVPSDEGGLFFHVRERTAPDPAELASLQSELSRQLLERKRDALFRDWLNAMWNEAQVNLRLPPRPAPAPDEESGSSPQAPPPS